MNCLIIGITCVICITSELCNGIQYINIPTPKSKVKHLKHSNRPARRQLYKNLGELLYEKQVNREGMGGDEERENALKTKIDDLIDATVHSTELAINALQGLKERTKGKPDYKIGLLLTVIKKCNSMMNELFNVAVKHRDDWKAIEMLKIYELVVHTNVDVTNYIRQLVEIHIMNLNADHLGGRKVVLMKK